MNISGEYAYDEVVLDSQPSQKVRSTFVLQRRNSGDLELFNSVEAGLGGIQGSAKEAKMEHDLLRCQTSTVPK